MALVEFEDGQIDFDEYDEWLVEISDPSKRYQETPDEIYDNEGNLLCLYCYSKLPKDHISTVCDNCYPEEEGDDLQIDFEGYDDWLVEGSDPSKTRNDDSL